MLFRTLKSIRSAVGNVDGIQYGQLIWDQVPGPGNKVYAVFCDTRAQAETCWANADQGIPLIFTPEEMGPAAGGKYVVM